MWNLIQTLEIFHWCPGIYRRLRKIDSSHSLIHKWITAFSTKQIFERFNHSPSLFKQSLFLSVHGQKKKKDFSFSKRCFPRKLIYQVGNRFWLSARTDWLSDLLLYSVEKFSSYRVIYRGRKNKNIAWFKWNYCDNRNIGVKFWEYCCNYYEIWILRLYKRIFIWTSERVKWIFKVLIFYFYFFF